jgi:hypothetical protein
MTSTLYRFTTHAEYRDLSTGKVHRPDGPAIVWANGDHEYFIMGKRHRIDGPAIEHADGFYRSWYINDRVLRTALRQRRYE